MWLKGSRKEKQLAVERGSLEEFSAVEAKELWRNLKFVRIRINMSFGILFISLKLPTNSLLIRCGQEQDIIPWAWSRTAWKISFNPTTSNFFYISSLISLLNRIIVVKNLHLYTCICRHHRNPMDGKNPCFPLLLFFF